MGALRAWNLFPGPPLLSWQPCSQVTVVLVIFCNSRVKGTKQNQLIAKSGWKITPQTSWLFPLGLPHLFDLLVTKITKTDCSHVYMPPPTSDSISLYCTQSKVHVYSSHDKVTMYWWAIGSLWIYTPTHCEYVHKCLWLVVTTEVHVNSRQGSSNRKSRDIHPHREPLWIACGHYWSSC